MAWHVWWVLERDQPRLRLLNKVSLWEKVRVLVSERKVVELPFFLIQTLREGRGGTLVVGRCPNWLCLQLLLSTKPITAEQWLWRHCFVSRQEKGRDQYGLQLGKK